METYNVILHKGVDYQSFWDDMELSDDGGTLHIPNRRVDSPNLRPNSPRQAWYTLSAEEVTTLKNDNRVKGVEIPPEFRDDIIIEHRASRTGDFTKTTSDSGVFLNWGLIRHKSKTNNYGGSSTTSEDYTYTLDGTGVDVVIQDSGVEMLHPEFFGKISEASAPRTQGVNWYNLSGVTGTQNANHNRDLDGHGTHVAGIVAGNSYGLATGARVYSVKVNGLEGSTDGSTGIATTDCFDVIKGWHNDKKLTRPMRPTVVNMSWGYSTTFTNASITAINYRGVSYTGSDIDTAGERESNYGLMEYQATVGVYSANVRILSIDTDIDEMIDAGIHITIAAGNRANKCDIPGGTDYNNYLTRGGEDVYYHRGSSPNGGGAILVGNMDSSVQSATQDRKSTSSECGPAVDIYAAGTNIMSCTSNTNKFTDAVYNFDSNYRQCNISGTSMAAPQVAGMVALYLQASPLSPPSEMKRSLQAMSGNNLYTSSADNDWTDSRSLLGGEQRVLFNKSRSSKPTIIKNIPSGFFQNGIKVTTK